MRCEEVQPTLLDFGKGQLSGPEFGAIEKHVGKCAECKALLAEELAFANRLATIPAQEPVNDVWALVRARTRPRRFSIRRLRDMVAGPAVVRKALALTAAVGIVFGGLYSGLRPEEPKPVVRQPQNMAVVVAWSDDPIGNHTDVVVDVIDDM